MARKQPVRHDPKYQGIQALPGMEILELTPQEKAEKFVSDLQASGWISQNINYLRNYINADIGIALSHIKQAHIKWVGGGLWEEEKFKIVTTSIASAFSGYLSDNSYSKYGALYDEKWNESTSNSLGNRYKEKDPTTVTDDELMALLEEGERVETEDIWKEFS